MLEALLKEHSSELLGALTGAGGLDTGEAKSLLPAALGGLGDAMSSGKLDLTSLLGGDGDSLSSILGKLDVAGIAASAGIGQAKAQTGLTSLIPVVMSLLGEQSGGAAGILGMLGGGSAGDASTGALGALGGIAGKLFGK